MSEDAAAPMTDAEKLADAKLEKQAAKTAAIKARQGHEKARGEIKRLRAELADAHEQAKDNMTIRPVVAPAKMRKRHFGLIISFTLVVLTPIALAGSYLYTLAADQYASTVAFTVRSEDISSSAADILGGIGAGLTGGGGGSAETDANILFEFMQSPDLVRRVDSQLDLPAIYSKYKDSDPLFSFTSDGTIENLTAYWGRMVKVSYDTSSRLMEVRTLAFTPQEARAIAETVFAESSAMINALSDIARADTMRYASEDLTIALDRLKSAREALTQFRLANEIVDVQADIQSQMGLLASLQGQQTEALIELDLLSDSARANDPRLDQAQRRLAVIEARIADERRKFGPGGTGPNGTSYANTVAEFERLSIDREFAERAYASALSTFDTSKAEATRQSRYLAAYITPTLAEQAEYPQRARLLATVSLFAFLIWVIGSLIFYALRERR
jgi:capsular polysaccharide transport system permease protein